MPSSAGYSIRIGFLLLLFGHVGIASAQVSGTLDHVRPTVSELLALHACQDTSCISALLGPMGYRPQTVLGSHNYFGWYPEFNVPYPDSMQSDGHTQWVIITDDHFTLDSVGYNSEDVWRLSFQTDDPAYVKMLRSQLEELDWKRFRIRSHQHLYWLPIDPNLSILVERIVMLLPSRNPSKMTSWKVRVYLRGPS
jgi:hypothetical protein